MIIQNHLIFIHTSYIYLLFFKKDLIFGFKGHKEMNNNIRVATLSINIHNMPLNNNFYNN